MPGDVSIMPIPNSNALLPVMPGQGRGPQYGGGGYGGTRGPTLQDILARLDRPMGGTDTYNSAISGIKGNMTAPGQLDPGYQATLDQIKNNAAYYGAQAGSQASSLAQKRGLAGSSIEQFGVQTGLNNVNRNAQDLTAQTYTQNLQRQQALQDQLANLQGQRSGQELTAGTQANITGANLTSDEIASLRNQQYQQQQLALQQSLGQQGIDLGYANIGASKDIAQQQGQNQLLGGALNGLFSGFGGGGFGSFGGGGLGILGTGGSAAAGGIPGLQGGAPLIGGQVAPGAFGGFTPGPGAILGAGAGAMWLANQGQRRGGTLGSFLANPIGAQLNMGQKALSSGGNAIKNVASSVGNAVSSVFPFN